MTDEVLPALPARRGHFLLESGYHTDLWLTLDAMFVDTRAVAPLVAALAEKLRPHDATAICGPMLGGAFLAQAVATVLGARFYFAEPVSSGADPGLFRAKYMLPSALRDRVAGERVAVVDDVISAGSSVRATVDALGAADASIVAVGALLLLGDAAPACGAQRPGRKPGADGALHLPLPRAGRSASPPASARWTERLDPSERPAALPLRVHIPRPHAGRGVGVHSRRSVL